MINLVKFKEFSLFNFLKKSICTFLAICFFYSNSLFVYFLKADEYPIYTIPEEYLSGYYYFMASGFYNSTLNNVKFYVEDVPGFNYTGVRFSANSSGFTFEDNGWYRQPSGDWLIDNYRTSSIAFSGQITGEDSSTYRDIVRAGIETSIVRPGVRGTMIKNDNFTSNNLPALEFEKGTTYYFCFYTNGYMHSSGIQLCFFNGSPFVLTNGQSLNGFSCDWQTSFIYQQLNYNYCAIFNKIKITYNGDDIVRVNSSFPRMCREVWDVVPIYVGNGLDATGNIAQLLDIDPTVLAIGELQTTLHSDLTEIPSEHLEIYNQGNQLVDATSVFQGDLNSIENAQIGNAAQSLNALDTSNNLSSNANFMQSANYVKNIFNRLIDLNEPLTLTIVVSLTVAIALIVVGKLRH